MPSKYTLSQTKDVLNIAEQQYASAKEKIQFTAFTSCIGVVAKNGGRLTGVHLVMIGKPPDDPLFGADATDVPRVIELVMPADAVVVFGGIPFWRDSESDVVKAAFQKLTAALSEKVGKSKFWERGIKLYQQYNKREGKYAATIAGEGIIVRDPDQ